MGLQGNLAIQYISLANGRMLGLKQVYVYYQHLQISRFNNLQEYIHICVLSVFQGLEVFSPQRVEAISYLID